MADDDWWDRLYADDEPPPARHTRRSVRGSAPAPEHTVRVELARPAVPEPEPFEPTVRQAAADLLPDDPKRRHRVLFLAYNGAAAAAGWWVGIGPVISSALHGADTVRDGVWMGIGLVFIAGFAELPTGWMRNPARHRAIRAVGWAFRIPMATAALALLLFTPDAAL